MIQILGALAVVAYGGYKLYQVIEEQTNQVENMKQEDTLTENIKAIEKGKLLVQAKQIQKEVARLHEIYITVSKLTAAGEMKKLDIKVEGVPLEEKLKEQEKKLMEISLKIKSLN
jgi:hypothetical protein